MPNGTMQLKLKQLETQFRELETSEKSRMQMPKERQFVEVNHWVIIAQNLTDR